MIQQFNKFDLLGQYAGGNFSAFVDNVMANRYNKPQWKNFFEWDFASISDTFEAMEAEVDLFPMASVIDVGAVKPKRSVQGVSMYGGKIPKMGHGYDLNETLLRQYYAIIAAGGTLASKPILDLFFNTINKVEFGIHARINSMAFMGMSSGHIILNSSNNPDGGVLIDLDLRVPTANKLYAGFDNGVDAAWTDNTATPLTDVQDVINYAIEHYMPADRLYMHRTLWLTFKTHPTVVAAVRGFYANTNTTGVISEGQLKQYLNELGWPPITLIDEASGLQVDGVTSNVNSWDASNIVLTGAGIIGKVKNAVPIAVDDPAARISYTEGGRIKLVETFDITRNIQTIEAECLAMPILSTAKRHIILDTSTTTTWS
jgi:hypothetical protein